MFSKEVQELAQETYEAIKKIAGNIERECSECNFGKICIGPAKIDYRKCKNCNGTGKVKGEWEWKPEVGEYCIYRPNSPYFNKLELITGINKEKRKLLLSHSIDSYPMDECIPLLHWEKLEEILEEMGYVIDLGKEYTSWEDFTWHCDLRQKYTSGYKFVLAGSSCKTRQEAVMWAVIELAKKMGV